MGWVEHAPLVRALNDCVVARRRPLRGVVYATTTGAGRSPSTPPTTHLVDPPHNLARLQDWADRRVAYIQLLGDPDPELLGGSTRHARGKARAYEATKLLRRLATSRTGRADRRVRDGGWATQALRRAGHRAALGRDLPLRALDEPDPIAAWQRAHRDAEGPGAPLNDRRFDALHFQGGGTDLTSGCCPSRAGSRRATSPTGASSTSRTCRPRRSSRRRTAAHERRRAGDRARPCLVRLHGPRARGRVRGRPGR